MPKAIIIGATSGIGKALAETLSQHGYTLGITGRRQELLIQMQKQLVTKVCIQPMDISQPLSAIQQLKDLIQALQGMDVLILNAGISHRHSDWQQDQAMVQVNILGFIALAQAGYDYFAQKGLGHIVGISSIAGIRGRGENLVYSASKAFVSNYLQGLRQKAFHQKFNLSVTEIIPGWVDTPLINSKKNVFWVASAAQAADQIYTAIKQKKSRAYITKRWAIIAWFLRLIPDCLHKRL